MPRPRKWRHVCCLPSYPAFGPLEDNSSKSMVTMTIDEYEVIRLIDYEKLDQEESANRMQVARSTVQAIYQSARHKLAVALIEGQILTISGGEIQEYNELERKQGCHRHRQGQRTD